MYEICGKIIFAIFIRPHGFKDSPFNLGSNNKKTLNILKYDAQFFTCRSKIPKSVFIRY